MQTAFARVKQPARIGAEPQPSTGVCPRANLLRPLDRAQTLRTGADARCSGR
jgi:hypothetical protein